MKFLIDNALSPSIATGLTQNGFDAIHVRDVSLEACSDLEIFEFARDASRIIVSADTDFGTLLFRTNAEKPSFILFRISEKRPDFQLRLLLNFISRFNKELVEGSILVMEDKRIRIRKLPMYENPK